MVQTISSTACATTPDSAALRAQVNTPLCHDGLLWWYRRLNALFFAGELPENIEARFSARLRRSLGHAGYEPHRAPPARYRVVLARWLHLDPSMFLDVLLHEMIHVFQYVRFERTGERHWLDRRRVAGTPFAGTGHGAVFHDQMQRLNAYGFGISVRTDLQSKDAGGDGTLRHGAWVRMHGGAQALFGLPRPLGDLQERFLASLEQVYGPIVRDVRALSTRHIGATTWIRVGSAGRLPRGSLPKRMRQSDVDEVLGRTDLTVGPVVRVENPFDAPGVSATLRRHADRLRPLRPLGLMAFLATAPDALAGARVRVPVPPSRVREALHANPLLRHEPDRTALTRMWASAGGEVILRGLATRRLLEGVGRGHARPGADPAAWAPELIGAYACDGYPRIAFADYAQRLEREARRTLARRHARMAPRTTARILLHLEQALAAARSEWARFSDASGTPDARALAELMARNGDLAEAKDRGVDLHRHALALLHAMRPDARGRPGALRPDPPLVRTPAPPDPPRGVGGRGAQLDLFPET